MRLSPFPALLGLLLASAPASPGFAQDAPSPVKPAPAAASAAAAGASPAAAGDLETTRWAADLAAFDAADRAAPPPAGGVLFVGSSSIRRWGELEAQFASATLPVVIKRGLGGSRIDDWTKQLGRLVLRYRPRMVLLYAGDNDIAEGRSPAAVLASVKTFVAGVHASLAGTRVAFISIKPSPRRSQLLANVRQANELVRSYAATDPQLDYIDIHTPMLGADGQPRAELFIADGLHLNDAGYALWRSVIADRLR